MKLAKWLFDHNCRGIIHAVFGRLAKKDEMIRWGLEHGKYAYEAEDAFGYGEKVKAYLRRRARALPGVGVYPNPQVGYGALCVRDSIPV